MGIFRVCLALCVVLSHGLNLPIPAATADVAVQTFYIVSGFYMGLVLTEKYHSPSSFFLNRALRLYPAYFVVALATLAHSLVRMMSGRVRGILPQTRLRMIRCLPPALSSRWKMPTGWTARFKRRVFRWGSCLPLALNTCG